jgi:hypothetical protein
MTRTVNARTRGEWLSAAAWLRRHPEVFSRDTFYARLNDGTIPCLRVGKKLLVRDDVLDHIAERESVKT